MKNKLIIGLMSVFLAVGMYHLSTSNLEMDYVPDVMAVTATMAPSAACTDPTIASFQGQLAYTVTWAAAAAGSASSPSASAVLSNAVNGETGNGVVATLNGAGAPLGMVILTSTTPTGKVGGLQCQTSVGATKVEGNGDGTDNASFDIAVSNLADADTGYTAGDKYDSKPALTPGVLFGTGGTIAAALPTDGGGETDAALNGEIAFGTATEANGGSELHSIIDITNYNVAAGTDIETLTIKTTPQ